MFEEKTFVDENNVKKRGAKRPECYIKITQYDWKGGNAGLSTAIDQGIDTENITKLLNKYVFVEKITSQILLLYTEIIKSFKKHKN